ncbi:MAG TPA: porin family protein [Chitinophagaceae bacterium]|nr:porin family protein [Chitinophagaceae bacterium]
MKKMIFTMAALCLATATFAQTTFGVKVGPNFSSLATKNDGSKETSKMLVGVAGGVYANLPIAPQFFIQPSLMYEGKGGKDTFQGIDTKTRLNYLTLPIDLLFKPEMPNGSGAWIIGIGPYFGYGLSGKSSVSSGNLEGSADPFKADNGLKRFDAGANVQLGYEMAAGFNIGLNAELGLLNLRSGGDNDNSARNTSFGVTVGYTLGKH